MLTFVSCIELCFFVCHCCMCILLSQGENVSVSGGSCFCVTEQFVSLDKIMR